MADCSSVHVALFTSIVCCNAAIMKTSRRHDARLLLPLAFAFCLAAETEACLWYLSRVACKRRRAASSYLHI